MMKKKIAIVFNRMNVGGAEKAMVNFLKAIDTDRYDITLFTFDQNGAYLDELPQQIKIRYTKGVNPQTSLFHNMKRFRIGAVAKGLYCRLMIRLCKNEYAKFMYTMRCLPPFEEKFDCAIAYKFGWEDAATVIYRLNAEQRCAWVHGTIEATKSARDRHTRKHGAAMQALFCVSEEAKRRLDLVYPEFKSKTTVIHNVFDSQDIIDKAQEPLKVALRETSILTVGRLVDVKGQDMIPRAVKLLVNAGYDVYWYLVGEGPLQEKILRESERYGVTDRVISLGTRMNPYPYIKQCDIYVQPSFSEGYCTTTVEAKILQKPIVTTDAPGMREQFVSGENGLIVDAMTPEALAEGVATLLDNPELRERFVENLKNQSFDNSRELQKLYDFIGN